MYFAERTMRAMGSSAQVLICARSVSGAQALADLAQVRIELLEQCWSRFRDSSELNRLNAHAGRGPLHVSQDLGTLVGVMLEAEEWTQGAFDPTVLGSMQRLGYDGDFADVVAREALSSVHETFAPSRGMSGIQFDPVSHEISLPIGVGLDPGAIGKGLAGDIVASEIHAAGAEGVLINLGGDISTRGDAGGTPWVVSIVDHRREDATTPGSVQLRGAQRAIATSSSLRRRWHGRHHVIDPLTGQPSESDLAQVTVIGSTGWQAEAAATFALVRGRDEAQTWLAQHDLEAVLFPHDPNVEPIRVREALHV